MAESQRGMEDKSRVIHEIRVIKITIDFELYFVSFEEKVNE